MARVHATRVVIYLTNAVKNFKFELRGKRRIDDLAKAAEFVAQTA